MRHDIEDRTIAFAGILQATRLVQQVARQGAPQREAFEASIHSLFQIDAPSCVQVYGGLEGVRMGLELLVGQLDGKQPRDMELTRYVLNVLHLERKLAHQPHLLAKIGDGIRAAEQQAAHFSRTHANVIARLAGIYQETVSTLTPRIIVNGEHGHLADPDNANKVRALLLAAMRAAIMWRQCGGTRLQLLFKRKDMVRCTQQLLAQARD